MSGARGRVGSFPPQSLQDPGRPGPSRRLGRLGVELGGGPGRGVRAIIGARELHGRQVRRQVTAVRRRLGHARASGEHGIAAGIGVAASHTRGRAPPGARRSGAGHPTRWGPRGRRAGADRQPSPARPRPAGPGPCGRPGWSRPGQLRGYPGSACLYRFRPIGRRGEARSAGPPSRLPIPRPRTGARAWRVRRSSSRASGALAVRRGADGSSGGRGHPSRREGRRGRARDGCETARGLAAEVLRIRGPLGRSRGSRIRVDLGRHRGGEQRDRLRVRLGFGRPRRRRAGLRRFGRGGRRLARSPLRWGGGEGRGRLGGAAGTDCGTTWERRTRSRRWPRPGRAAGRRRGDLGLGFGLSRGVLFLAARRAGHGLQLPVAGVRGRPGVPQGLDRRGGAVEAGEVPGDPGRGRLDRRVERVDRTPTTPR